MYARNHLAARLRAASLGREAQLFLTGPTLSYGGLFAAAERMAGALVSAGVRPGDRVAAQIEKSADALALYLGSVMAGAVFLPLNTAYTQAEVGYFLGDAGPAVFVCDPARESMLAFVAAGVPRLLTLGRDGDGTLADLAARQPDGFAPVACGADDLAAMLYTSGTTGRSKGAMLTHGNLASNAAALARLWKFSEKDRLIHALPIFHTHGLFVATNVALASGCSLTLLPGFDADAIVALMPQSTVLMGVPTFYVRLLSHPGLAEAARSMRLFVSGSAPLMTETHDRWRAVTGHAILERYGMTETNMNTSNPYDGERRAGTVGFPLPGVDLRITDPMTGAEMPRGEIGLIEVRGDNVFKGYWRMPEKTREEFRTDGFFITGDLGTLDADGYVAIVGRSKDLVITGGYNVYPKEVEEAIDGLDGVLESAVIGLPHADFGEVVVACVVARPGAAVSEAAIMAALARVLARFKQPRRIFLIDELPRNTMGKVQKALLRERYCDSFPG